MEAGGGWCSNVITAQSLNTAPILATGRLHGPLKFVAFAQDLFLLHVSSCEASWECSSCGDEINQLRKENKILAYRLKQANQEARMKAKYWTENTRCILNSDQMVKVN